MTTVSTIPVQRPEALQALGQDIEARDIHQQVLASLKAMLAMHDSGVVALGIVRRARAAVAAAEGVQS